METFMLFCGTLLKIDFNLWLKTDLHWRTGTGCIYNFWLKYYNFLDPDFNT